MERRGIADGVPSAEQTADDIWKAVKLMLPRDKQDRVLWILMHNISDKLGAQRTSLQPPPASSASAHEQLISAFRRAESSRGNHSVSFHPGSLPKRLLTPPRVRFTDAPNSGPASKPGKYAALQHSQRAVTCTNIPVAVMRRIPPADSPTSENNVPIEVRITGKPSKYKCPRCPQIMTMKQNMQLHITGHGAVGKFSCNECDFATDSKCSFTWHAKAHLQPME